MTVWGNIRNEAAIMSSTGNDIDIEEFLVNINLGQYLPNFKEYGYNVLTDCVGINNHVLQQMGVLPTGHRRRILKQLDTTLSKMQGNSLFCENLKLKDLKGLEEKQYLSSDQESPISNSGVDGTSLIPATLSEQLLNKAYIDKERFELAEQNLPEANHDSFTNLDISSLYQNSDSILKAINLSGSIKMNTQPDTSLEEAAAYQAGEHLAGCLAFHDPPSSFAHSCETKYNESKHLMFADEDYLSDSEPNSPFFKFKGEMIDNDLYDSYTQNCMKVFPRASRSFILRHRPVPEIPESSKVQASSSSLQKRRNVDLVNTCCTERQISQNKTFTDEKPPIISPYGETFICDNPKDAKELHGNEFLACENKSDLGMNEEYSSYKNLCSFNNQEEKTKEFAKNESLSRENKSLAPAESESESVYSIVEQRSLPLKKKKNKDKTHSASCSKIRSGDSDRLVSEQTRFWQFDGDQTLTGNDSITPYACFYGPSVKKVKAGWLDKLSPQGKRMFQKRWVKFDGDSISYYNNEKEVFSKGIILLSAIATVRVHGENKFEVVTSHRTFVFRVDKEEERNDWVNTMLNALKSQSDNNSQSRTSVTPEKSGYLELKGYKAKIFILLQGNTVWICKNEQDFKTGFGITLIPMNVANVKQVDRTAKQSFEIITPYKSFSFTAESEREKQDWIEALQQSIAETLSDYEVAEKIWFNESNRSCADCKAPSPDWASINLCVVICKKCAGQHRSLGPRDSKVRSLKMDASIWSNELIELFIIIGNKRANSFWAGNLPPDEELHMDAPAEKRIAFITQKYKEGKFRKAPFSYKTKEQLNKALCAAVVKQDVLETLMLLFSGADAMCATGDPVYSTPYLLAKKAGQRLQMEFLYHNKFSDLPNYDTCFESGFSEDSSHSTFLCEFLYKVSSNTAKLLTEKKLKEDCNKRWCTLESGFLSYYENDKTTTPNGMIDINEVICLVVHKSDFFLNRGDIFTFEIYLMSERVFLFGAETAYSQRKWTWAIAKHFVPPVAECLLERDCDLIGQLYYKDCHNLDQWRKGWFAIEKSSLYFCLEMENAEEDSIYLRRLQELTISSVMQNGEKIEVLLLVEKGRTLYIHGHTKLDFMVWYTAIEKAAGTDGNALQDQQLSKNDVPIIVNSCIAFVTQYGLGSKQIYLTNGDSFNVAELLESFKKDARSVKLRAGKHQLEDVTDVLKSFLSQIDDALLTKELYPFWISAL
ncbi:PREDICTED: arf-GAP with Rho-GAP domain, ANK repeat and PH domain-containing protein 2, partial [Fulmarus glacialis]|uniref:arf-GAP with Rho-GAP domain, ANK repeat and PH domain-containing protein 2 n=1 Tax=Fulmarus glacialis TaxID=30455 RepID=UPI00051B4621